MLRTSIVPTMLKAGVGPNVIPSEAEATLDIRALPDEDIKKFYEEMNRVIADPAVKIVPLPATRPPSPASRLDTDMYRVLEQVSKSMYPTRPSCRRCRPARATWRSCAPRACRATASGPR
jgi:acetylornithine deacetylase/succinyl-diaminopimelate desuccinylase-like protein